MVTAAQFLSDVTQLSCLLPDAQYVVNLCTDRYRFAVGFGAALIRRQVTLLPSNAAIGAFETLAHRYEGAYFLHDGESLQSDQLIIMAYPGDLGSLKVETVPALPADQEAAILFTSGSTGEPVPNSRSWGAFVRSTRAAGRALGVTKLNRAAILGTVPHQHSYGIESVIMLALQHGFAFQRERSPLPADIFTQMEAMPRPRVLVTTPVHLRSLVAETSEVPLVDSIVSATAPLGIDLARQAEQRFGALLHEIYGCSEVGQIAARRTVETDEWTCIDDLVLEARDSEVWASGPAAGAPAALNDLIELKSPSRFRLIGRKTDMVSIAGKRSSLAFLNQRLVSIPGVVDGVFVPPDKDDGRLAAYVVAPGMSAPEILAALRREIDPAFLPRPLRIIDTLPRNSLGKLTRQALEELALGECK